MDKKYQQIPGDWSTKIIRSLLTLVMLATGMDGLRDVRLEGVRYVRQGDDVTLHCNYKLDNDSLYVVKWYRGSEEFYRFVPKEVPPKKFFAYPGLSFNEHSSNEHDASLKNVVLETSGKFRCAVSAEHTFQTFVASQDLTVVVIDYNDRPGLEVEQLSYYPGETGKANCSLGKVSHPLNFTWFINDKEVPRSASKEVTMADPEEPSLSRSMSLLEFEVGSSSSQSPTNSTTSSTNKVYGGGGGGNGDMRLKCRAQLFDVYSELSAEVVIQTTQPRYSLSNQDTLRRSSAAINGGTRQEPSSRIWGKSILLLLLPPLFRI